MENVTADFIPGCAAENGVESFSAHGIYRGLIDAPEEFSTKYPRKVLLIEDTNSHTLWRVFSTKSLLKRLTILNPEENVDTVAVAWSGLVTKQSPFGKQYKEHAWEVSRHVLRQKLTDLTKPEDEPSFTSPEATGFRKSNLQFVNYTDRKRGVVKREGLVRIICSTDASDAHVSTMTFSSFQAASAVYRSLRKYLEVLGVEVTSNYSSFKPKVIRYTR
jgi:ribosomal protein L36